MAKETAGVCSTEFYRTLVENAAEGMVTIDESKDIVYANPAIEGILGYSPDELVGCSKTKIIPDRLQPAHANALASDVETGGRNIDWNGFELPVLHKDGHEVPTLVSLHEHEHGGNHYFTGIIREITERRQREIQLQSQTSRLEAIFEHSPDMIAVHDIDGGIRDVNKRLCEALGYTREEILKRDVWDLDPTADPDRSRAFWESLPPNTPRRFEGELERKDGSTFPIEIHIIRLDLDGDDRFFAIDRDISEQTQRERELVQQNERLDRFTSVVSHDLRNPLQVARGHLTLLREDCESDHIDEINDALGRMETLIEELLLFAQAGEETMDIEPVRLPALLRSCWETLSTEHATLTVETERTLRADHDQLSQLLSNLVQNAIEHGGPDVTVSVGDTETGFFIADDGPGLPETANGEIFNAGYTTAADGTGFGLSIVEEIAERHGWDITATNERTGGARFEIELE